MALSGMCEACGRKTTTVMVSVLGNSLVCGSCSQRESRLVSRPQRIIGNTRV